MGNLLTDTKHTSTTNDTKEKKYYYVEHPIIEPSKTRLVCYVTLTDNVMIDLATVQRDKVISIGQQEIKSESILPYTIITKEQMNDVRENALYIRDDVARFEHIQSRMVEGATPCIYKHALYITVTTPIDKCKYYRDTIKILEKHGYTKNKLSFS